MIVTVRDWGFSEAENSFLELAAALPTDTEKLKEILDSGLDVNAPSRDKRSTLAYCALEQFGGYNSVCTKPHVFSAYEQGGELHMKYDTSALMDVVRLFLAHGMDVNGSTAFGTILDTMLYGANDENTLAAARLLLQHGADPNLPDSCGQNICDRAGEEDFGQIQMWNNPKPGLPDYYGRFCVLLSEFGGRPLCTDWPY